eukprot:1331647-Pyramimonas_sp.AAC.1
MGGGRDRRRGEREERGLGTGVGDGGGRGGRKGTERRGAIITRGIVEHEDHTKRGQHGISCCSPLTPPLQTRAVEPSSPLP